MFRWNALRIAMIAVIAAFTSNGARCQGTGIISGFVTDVTGAVIPNADVKVSRAGSKICETRTNEVGQFRCAGLVPGTYAAVVSAVAFLTKTIADVEARDGQETKMGSVQMQLDPAKFSACEPDPVGRPNIVAASMGGDQTELRGQVVLAPNTPAAGVRISVERPGNKHERRSFVTRGDGRFQFTGLKPGIYRVRARRKGYADFVIDSAEIKTGQRMSILEALELHPCPKAGPCPVTRSVHIVALCL